MSMAVKLSPFWNECSLEETRSPMSEQATARMLMCDRDTSFERLEGVISKVEDWHAIRILWDVQS